jgi:hypothetical protein
MQPREPDEFAPFVAVTLAGAGVTGLNPAFDRTGIAFDSVRRHAFSGNYGPTFANTHTHAAIRAPVIIDHRLFLDHFNSIHRAVAHTVSASDAFFFVNIHFQFLNCFLYTWEPFLFSCALCYRVGQLARFRLAG